MSFRGQATLAKMTSLGGNLTAVVCRRPITNLSFYKHWAQPSKLYLRPISKLFSVINTLAYSPNKSFIGPCTQQKNCGHN